VSTSQIQAGQVTYAAARHVEPYPYNQFVLARLYVQAHGTNPITVAVDESQSSVSFEGQQLPLTQAQPLTLTVGQVPSNDNQNPPNSQGGTASIFLRSGQEDADGITMDRG